MRKDKFKDVVFEIMNETDQLPIINIEMNDREDRMDVSLKDGSKFEIHIKKIQ